MEAEGRAMTGYAGFLAAKAIRDPATGIADPVIAAGPMKDFQRDLVRWALRRGRAALFAGTGLGKTLMELAWAEAVVRETGAPVLILTPLAVAEQFVEEGVKFGIGCRRIAGAPEVSAPGIYISNYEKLHRFNMAAFAGVVLDESSILKAQDGKTRTALIAASQHVPFRLAASATPAPNDVTELGNHAEFLGVMSMAEMLAMFFVHDGGAVRDWRLKGHGAAAFWRWMAHWAVMITRPSDLGYDDAGYVLPPLHRHHHRAETGGGPDIETGTLFPMEARTMGERLAARRGSIAERTEVAARLIMENDRPWVVWCNLNDEADAVVKAIPGAKQVKGADADAVKIARLNAFRRGDLRVLVTKPTICGWGMNWQHCRDTAFVGLNDSFEQVFQAVRRFWRFGQTDPVHAHFIAAETEGAVVANLRRKEEEADRMIRAMVANMADLSAAGLRGTVREKADYQPRALALPDWLAGGDRRAA